MKPNATAPLVFWLAVVAGLVGVSVLRFMTPSLETYEVFAEIGPLWVGTIAGVAIGQLVGALRVRAWVPVVVLLVAAVGPGIWVMSMMYAWVDAADRAVMRDAMTALAPAALAGYLALSERGALVAFWYPVTLWMVAILDGQSSLATLDRRAALPLVVGLAALFVAFLRARETRRAALWCANAPVRIGEARDRTVLRTTPLRGLGEHVGVGLVGGGALVLAGWIAPHLWHVDRLDAQAPSPETLTSGAGNGTSSGVVCCESLQRPWQKQQTRVSEYFPLLRARQEEAADRRAWDTCTTCRVPVGEPVATSYDPASSGSGTGDTGNTYYGTGTGAYDPVPAPGTAPVAQPTVPEPAPIEPTPSVVKTQPPLPPKPVVAPAAPKPVVPDAPKPSVSTPAMASSPVAYASSETPASPPPPPSAPLGDTGTPWRGMIAVVLASIVMHLTGRAARRAIVLRHLARPFWPETVDQRISNHWERVLIALRDAGIVPARDEAPMAFARRVGVPGLETCASILERVRHGVGIEAADLDSMAAASSSVFSAARSRAGAVARALSWLRSPAA